MRKVTLFLYLLCAVSLVSGVSFAADPLIKTPVTIVWGSGSLGSTTQMVATAIGTVVSKYEPNLKISVQTTGGNTENARLLRAKKIDVAHSSEGYTAANALGPFKGEDKIEMWGLFALYSNETVICVLKDSPIKKVEDLEGKRLAGGPPGAGLANNTKDILRGYGLTDKVRVTNLGYNESVDALKDGVVDAMVNYASEGFPSPSFAQLDQTAEYRLIPIDPEIMKKVYEENPDKGPSVIKPGTLKAVKEDVPVLATFSIEWADSRMSDEVAYAIVKTMYEHTDELSTYHKLAGTIKLENALRGFSTNKYLHPGAAKYYKERGILPDTVKVGIRK